MLYFVPALHLCFQSRQSPNHAPAKSVPSNHIALIPNTPWQHAHLASAKWRHPQSSETGVLFLIKLSCSNSIDNSWRCTYTKRSHPSLSATIDQYAQHQLSCFLLFSYFFRCWMSTKRTNNLHTFKNKDQSTVLDMIPLNPQHLVFSFKN